MKSWRRHSQVSTRGFACTTNKHAAQFLKFCDLKQTRGFSCRTCRTSEKWLTCCCCQLRLGEKPTGAAGQPATWNTQHTAIRHKLRLDWHTLGCIYSQTRWLFASSSVSWGQSGRPPLPGTETPPAWRRRKQHSNRHNPLSVMQQGRFMEALTELDGGILGGFSGVQLGPGPPNSPRTWWAEASASTPPRQTSFSTCRDPVSSKQIRRTRCQP